MAKISNNFIQRLRESVDIADFLAPRLQQFRPAGNEFVALCPFHDDSKPSLTISPQKQFYHCFVCKASGDALKFLMEHEKLEFLDAVHQLAQHCGMEVEYEDGGAPSEKRRGPSPWDLLDSIAGFYRTQLGDHAGASAYMQRRKIPQGVADQYALGYAPEARSHIPKLFATSDEHTALLKELGMMVDDERGLRSRFRDRFMFPIRDARGRIVGFGGRAMTDKMQPKYLNSSESFAFHKGDLLYGQYESRTSKAGRRLVVEGYTDVLALAAHGVEYAVATLGTAATEEHFRKLFRIEREVVLCFDGDEAGRKAAVRAFGTALPQMQDGRLLRVMFLPKGEDPDSLIHSKGAGYFRQLQDEALDMETFMVECIGEGFNLERADGIAAFIGHASAMLARLPEQGALAHTLCATIAERLRQDRELWLQKLNQAREQLSSKTRSGGSGGSYSTRAGGSGGSYSTRAAHSEGGYRPDDDEIAYDDIPQEYLGSSAGFAPDDGTSAAPVVDANAPAPELCEIVRLLHAHPGCAGKIPVEMIDDIQTLKDAQPVCAFILALSQSDVAARAATALEWGEREDLAPYLVKKDDPFAEWEGYDPLDGILSPLIRLGRRSGARGRRLLDLWVANPQAVAQLGEADEQDLDDVKLLVSKFLAALMDEDSRHDKATLLKLLDLMRRRHELMRKECTAL